MRPEHVLDTLCPFEWNRFKAIRVFENSTDRANQDDIQLSASQKLGVVPQTLLMAEEEQKYMLALSGTDNFKHVEAGDFVISLRSFEGGFESSSYTGCVSPAYTVLRPKFEVSTSFWRYLFKSEVFKKILAAFNVGIRDGKSIRYDDFSEFLLAFPEISKQQEIGNFLDRETTRIDALVVKKTRFMELLREKRQTLITHAVTKGLDPSVKMKDSGVEWLGEVPDNWEVKRLRFLCKNIKAGPFGSALTKNMYVTFGYRVYGQEQVIPGNFSIGDYYISPETYKELSQYAVISGDILISCVGTFGKIAVVPEKIEPGIINPRLIRIRVNQAVTPMYLTTLMRSSVVYEQFSLWSRGGTMDVINIGILSEIILAVPPCMEQEKILDYLAHETTRIDTLIQKTQHSIDLLKERRAALITAAVTGQIDLRETA